MKLIVQLRFGRCWKMAKWTSGALVVFGLLVVAGAGRRPHFVPGPPLNYFTIDDMMFMVKELRSGQMNEAYRWPMGVIPYEIAPEFSPQSVFEMQETMDYISAYTCIKFRRRRKSDVNFVQFMYVQGKCSSFVGNIRQGPQPIYLDPDSSKCGKPTFGGHVLHELVHCIGFFHEHARDDRDSYVDIKWDNLKDGDRTRVNFNKNKDNRIKTEDFGVPYNYGSVMHYSMRANSINGDATIVRKATDAQPRPFRGRMGQREKLTYGDVMMIQSMYKKECPGGADMDDIPQTDSIPTLADWMDASVSN